MGITHDWWPWYSFRCISSLTYQVLRGCVTPSHSAQPHTTSLRQDGGGGGPRGKTYFSPLLLSPQAKTFPSAKSFFLHGFDSSSLQARDPEPTMLRYVFQCKPTHGSTHRLAFPYLTQVLRHCSTISKSSRKN